MNTKNFRIQTLVLQNNNSSDFEFFNNINFTSNSIFQDILIFCLKFLLFYLNNFIDNFYYFFLNLFYQLILEDDARNFLSRNFFAILIFFFSVIKNFSSLTGWITKVIIVNLFKISVMLLHIIDFVIVFSISNIYEASSNCFIFIWPHIIMILIASYNWIKLNGFKIVSFIKHSSFKLLSTSLSCIKITYNFIFFIFFKLLFTCNKIVFIVIYPFSILRPLICFTFLTNKIKLNYKETSIMGDEKKRKKRKISTSKIYKTIFRLPNEQKVQEKINQPIDNQIYKYR
jgi:hypothetical protein